MAEGGQKRSKTGHRTPAQASRRWQDTKDKPGVRAKNKSRMKARRQAIKAGKVKRNDGVDVHHKDGNPLNNKAKNLVRAAPSKNRSTPRKLAARGGRATAGILKPRGQRKGRG